MGFASKARGKTYPSLMWAVGDVGRTLEKIGVLE